MRSTQRPSIVPCPPRVPMVDRPFPPSRHRWPTSSSARQPRKSRRESPRCRVDERRPTPTSRTSDLLPQRPPGEHDGDPGARAITSSRLDGGSRMSQSGRSSIEELQDLGERLARERQELRAVGASKRRLEANRRQLIRAQWALSAELIARYCDKEAA
jgi:hypothetical protein